jgi:predicted LPLAT superfamily acyltransferase
MVASPQPEKPAWNGRTLGGKWLFDVCVTLMPHVGARVVRLGSYVIATGFLLAGGRFQYGSFAYWRRVTPRAGWVLQLMRSWRRYASFGRILCDRVIAHLRPDRYTFEYEEPERLRQVIAGRQGCILLAAHMGNWELSGFRLTHMASGTVNLVMVRNDKGYVQAFINERLGGNEINVIDPRDPLGASLAIHAALSRGETVCMLGDRVFGDQPSCMVDFFGAKARFPIGPFHTAAVAGVPILVCFLMKQRERHYVLTIDPPWQVPAAKRGPERQAALQAAVQRWAHRLEQEVRKDPLQWHNFYDFWA